MVRKKDYQKIVKNCILIGVCLAFALLLAVQIAPSAFADDENSDDKKVVDPLDKEIPFSTVIYDGSSGLPTSVANDIVQTDEGFIWIASYGGLVRFDGNDFERIDSKGSPASVSCLFVDSQGRLWIGSNDDGVALMENGKFHWWNEAGGLPADKIRGIVEGEDGTMYVGTISGIGMISPKGDIKRLDQPKIKDVYVGQMKLASDGTLYCVSNEGDYITVRGEKLDNYVDHEKCNIKDMISVLPDPEESGMIYIGTKGSEIYHVKAKGNPSGEAIDVSPLTNITNMQMIDGNLWICARNGIGLIDEKGFHYLDDLLQSSASSVMKDYEGNLWFSSSRLGVLKVTPNQFADLFGQFDIPEHVVNCTRVYDETLFIGTEVGLLVLSKQGLIDSVPITEAKYASGGAYPADDLIKVLEGIRIRSIIRDSKERLWISTWQAKGLLRYDHGKLTVFDESAGLPSDSIRVVDEADDGSIVVACTGGVSVIEGDRVTKTYDEDDGLETNESLTVCCAPNGDILVGSNGGGIYVISGDKTRCYDKKDGLDSNVIMRIYYDEKHDLYWIMTGNSIAYMTPDYKITNVDGFPYPDNLDMYENNRGEMWVLSGDGIYVVSEEDMLANGKITYTHYGMENGLSGTVVSNSYSELTKKGNLYIPTNTGVMKVNINNPGKDYKDIKQAVPFIEGDNKMYYPDKNGNFKIPASVKKITIFGYVFNYSLTDPQVACQLEGFDRQKMFFRQSEMHPMVYTNLSGGTYKYTMTLLDDTGDESKSLTVKIIKQRAFYEHVWFYILLFMALFALMFLIFRLYVNDKMKKLEERHQREQVTRELQMANRIQMSMLPHEFPPFPDRHEFDIFATMDPAREVGGDFYDFFLIDDDHLCLVIADVSGKGIPASLYMMNSKVVLQTIAKTGVSVDEILTRVNDALCDNNQLEMFITVWVGVLEISTGKLMASNAGHEYPAIMQAGEKFELYKDKHGLVLGGMEGMTYSEYELQLQPGDKIFVYTDGLPEATDAELNMFGTDRMLDALNEDPDAAPEQLLRNVRGAVDAFVKEAEQFDDLTMLCLEYKG